VNFAINSDFADSSGDQLGVLGAKIKNEDFVSVNILHAIGRHLDFEMGGPMRA